MAEQFAYFLTRLSEAQERQGSILDQSVILYGSSNSTTHNNSKLSARLGSGRQLGLQHGRFLKFGSDVPLTNLFVTMLNCVGAERASFADSTGEISQLRHA